MSEVYQKLPLGQLKVWPGSLRKTADQKSLEYQQLRDTIRNIGFTTAINVRKHPTEPGIYEIMDGVQRWNACKDLGYTEIPVLITDVEDNNVLQFQITANLHRVETKPFQYRDALKAMLIADPLLTESTLAAKLAMSPAKLNSLLQLDRIQDERIRSLINEGKITLSNAFALSRLPADEQGDFVDRALSLSANEFLPIVYARANEIKSANEKGKAAAAPSFSAIAKLRTLKDMETVLATSLEPVLAAITAEGSNDLNSIVRSVLRWTIRLDPASVKEAKAKWDENQAKKEAAAKEREAKKEAEKNAPKPAKEVTLAAIR